VSVLRFSVSWSLFTTLILHSFVTQDLVKVDDLDTNDAVHQEFAERSAYIDEILM
jgi:hypothetical protein